MATSVFVPLKNQGLKLALKSRGFGGTDLVFCWDNRNRTAFAKVLSTEVSVVTGTA